jgi:hypothetical protein
MSLATPPPATTAEVLARYTELRALHQRGHDAIARRLGNTFKATAIPGAAILYATFHSRQAVSPWFFAIGVPSLIALISYITHLQTRLAREQRLLVLYDRNLSRADGTEPQSGRTGLEPGQELRLPDHLYDRDLDILGPNSLFGLLATTRTGPGERGLAHYLLDPATHEETLQRQHAVQELLPQTALREKIALLGASSFQQVTANFFDTWLDPEPAPPAFPRAARPILVLTALLNTALLLAGFIHLLPWSTLFPNLALTLCIQAAICFYLRPRVRPLLDTGPRLQQSVRLIADGIALLQSSAFTAPKLTQLQRASLQPIPAVKPLKRLDSLLTIVDQRKKEWFFAISLLLAAGTQTAISVAQWKRRHAAAMRSWLTAWAEFEALNALATYAFEHPVGELNSAGEAANAWPELLPPSQTPAYEARGLGHPLLPNAVTNQVSLGPASSETSLTPSPPTSFYLVSGSNMAGKSTLLRSIGINAVLAYAGAPVRAASLRLTPLTLGASLALTDSLAEGRSKFLAEVERLHALLTASAASPLLFLVDEIFSGTNSEDRRAAAAAVLDKLLTNHAIGALSTHDLALTELATPANRGLNVHMASPSPEDPLAFDYKLKPGINTASSARAILRLIGITT